MYLRTGFFINCSLQSERSESREPIFGLWVAVVVWATEGGGGAYEGKWREWWVEGRVQTGSCDV